MTDFREALATALLSDGLWPVYDPNKFEGYRGGPFDYSNVSYADAIIAALPASIREAVELGLAWQRAEAALPDGRRLSGVWPIKPSGWEAGDGGTPERRGTGRTPAAALRALAAKLKEQR